MVKEDYVWMTSRDQCTLGTEDTFIGLLPLVIICCKDFVNTARNFRQLRFFIYGILLAFFKLLAVYPPS